MDRKIQLLKAKGIFNEPQVNSLGHGSFLPQNDILNDFIYKSSEDLKNKAFSLHNQSFSNKNDELSYKQSIESLLLLIRYLKEISSKQEPTFIVKEYRDVCKIIEEMNKKHYEKSLIFKCALFNLKFHYLQIESDLVFQSMSKKRFEERHLVYFLKLYKSLDISEDDELVICNIKKLERVLIMKFIKTE